MDDSRPTSRVSAAPVIAAGAILLFVASPLLYVLSTGPAVWLVEQGFVEPGSLEGVYDPVSYCMEHSTWFEALMKWYISFFEK